MDNTDISAMVNSKFMVSNFLTSENKEELINDIYKGLTAKQKYISSRFFYDEIGSTLFEEITNLAEYYPTRTEKEILKANAKTIIGNFDNLDIIDLGSGDCSKISILLDAIPENKIGHITYVPVDVSETAIHKSADILSLKYSGLQIHGLLADFMKHLTQLPGNNSKLICFFGSTLGNLRSEQANEFLFNLKKLMKPGDHFLLGLDMIKDRQILDEAYNDSQGVTASFNKNILNVINNIVGTDFDLLNFEHFAYYKKEKSRIEMHLRAKNDMVVISALFSEKIIFKKNETIHTENSHKYSEASIQEFARLTGLRTENIYTDAQKWFSVVKFKSVG